jgi:hypothetical protein
MVRGKEMRKRLAKKDKKESLFSRKMKKEERTRDSKNKEKITTKVREVVLKLVEVHQEEALEETRFKEEDSEELTGAEEVIEVALEVAIEVHLVDQKEKETSEEESEVTLEEVTE